MKKLSAAAYNEVRTWIYRNARPLELALWQFDFENGSPERVADMLRFYQNEDGGFGNGVEPDSWNPESSPYATMIAAGMLRGIGLAEQGQPILGARVVLQRGAQRGPGHGNHGRALRSDSAVRKGPWGAI